MNRYAGFWKRAGAFALDYIIILLYLLILGEIGFLIPWEIAHTFVWTIAFSPADTPGWVDFSFILVYALIGLNLVFLIFTRKHQTIYDLLAKTCVIKQSRV